ncbi:cytochrome P450 [Alicyclobacillus fodiniaquatilis]|uniref:Cytochrome P450 n=1 Tax=Alicyclobacillus fodiniaquatilis TaxID=1661150 RepID=A0ABW4JFP0_9BACL
MPLREGVLTGNPIRHYRRFRRDPISFLASTQSLGDLVRVPNVSGKTSYIIHHPDLVRVILALDEDKVIKGASAKILGLTLGEGLLTSEAQTHARQRRQLQPAFHAEAIEQLTDDILRLTDARIATWATGHSISITQQLLDLTLDIVFEGLFGTKVGSDRAALHAIIEEIVQYSAERLMQSVPLPYWLPTRANRSHHKAVRTLDAIIAQLLQNTANTTGKNNMLTFLLNVQNADGTALPVEEIRDQLVTFIIAGHETTANLLGWMIYTLAENPHVRPKLYAEVDTVLGTHRPNYVDVRQLGYLRQVMRETLRLYPPAWTMLRENIAPIETDDVTIRPKSTLIISPYLLHRDPQWFRDADQFLPERFDPALEHTWPRFAYIPFGAGSRTCIGNTLAQTEVTLVMTRILQKYRWSIDETHPVEVEPSVSLRVKGELWGRFEAR